MSNIVFARLVNSAIQHSILTILHMFTDAQMHIKPVKLRILKLHIKSKIMFLIFLKVLTLEKTCFEGRVFI